MNITVEKIDHLNGLLTINLTPEDYDSKWNESLKTIRKKVDMKGFRKGMVPMGLVKKMYGTSALVEEVNKILSDALYNHIVTERLNILGDPLPSLGQPEINWEEPGNFDFQFDLGFGPEIDLTFTDDDSIPYYKIQVNDELIQERVRSYAVNFGEMKSASEANVASMIEVDFTQLDESGNVLEGGLSIEKASFIVSKIADADTKESFNGKKVGDTLRITMEKCFTNATDLAAMLRIDKSMAESLRGEFSLEIKDISNWGESEVNQDLFDKIYGPGEVNSEEEFHARLKAEIERDFDYESEFKFVQDLHDKMLERFNLELPAAFLKRWLEKTNEKLSAEEIEQDWPAFERDLAWQIIKDKVAEKESVTVTQEDMMEMAKEITLAQFRQYGFSSLPEEELEKFAKQVLENAEQKRRIAESKRDEKIHQAFKNLLKLDVIELSHADFQETMKSIHTH